MRIEGFRRAEPMKLPEPGDLVYIQLQDGSRVPLITTVSEEVEGGTWRLRMLVDPEAQAGTLVQP
jgi:hypothetical protein